MRIDKEIFFGMAGCMEKCYHLHKRMEEAFSIMGGIQQPPSPCEPEESFLQHRIDVAEGEAEVLRITREIARGLLGKDYAITKVKEV